MPCGWLARQGSIGVDPSGPHRDGLRARETGMAMGRLRARPMGYDRGYSAATRKVEQTIRPVIRKSVLDAFGSGYRTAFDGL